MNDGFDGSNDSPSIPDDRDEQLSAWLDGELDAAEAAEIDAALRNDPAVAERGDELASIRELLRSADVEPRPGALDRIIAAVDAADDGPETAADHTTRAPVIDLAARRRIPSVAAIAAALVIIAGVVGGIGGPAGSLPAIGDLVAQHEAAAAVAPNADGDMDSMPMSDMDPMPADEAMAVVSLPHEMTMRHAFDDGETVHLVYETPSGEPVSIFRHTGEADLDALGDGSMSEIPAGPMWATDLDETHVVVVDGAGYVWVVIGEADDDMMDDMMDDLPTRESSVGDRLRACADAAVDPFRFWN